MTARIHSVKAAGKYAEHAFSVRPSFIFTHLQICSGNFVERSCHDKNDVSEKGEDLFFSSQVSLRLEVTTNYKNTTFNKTFVLHVTMK